MSARERRADRVRQRAAQIRVALGQEMKQARLGLDLSQRRVSASAGISQTLWSRIERGAAPSLRVDDLVAVCQPLGLDPSVKLYPAGRPLRDEAHLRLLERLHALLPHGVSWRTEVPIDRMGDQRAWDAFISFGSLRIGVEAETRLRDIQALERRIALKKRDGNVTRVVLLVAATRANRVLLRSLGSTIQGAFPVPGRLALDALAVARDPGGDALVLL
jgi:transcriptional regulator with XRE-family HTH domain